MNVDAQAAPIAGLLADGALAACIAENRRERAAQMFSIESVVQGVNNVYEELRGGIA